MRRDGIEGELEDTEEVGHGRWSKDHKWAQAPGSAFEYTGRRQEGGGGTTVEESTF